MLVIFISFTNSSLSGVSESMPISMCGPVDSAMLMPVSRDARLFPSSSHSFSLISLSPSDIEMVSRTSYDPPASILTLNE